MAKKQIEQESLSVSALGEWIGAAIGEGMAQGAGSAVSAGAPALQPLVDEIIASLRAQMIQSLASVVEAQTARDSANDPNETLAEIARTESTRPCIEDGCTSSAVSRNLCQRHYARKLYQERRERIGAHGFRVVPPRTTGAFGGEPVGQRKPLVAAVAPIVRRKRADGSETAAPVVEATHTSSPISNIGSAPSFRMPAYDTTPNPIAAAAAKSGITPESVARALGLMKD